jgi:hypothetical protein
MLLYEHGRGKRAHPIYQRVDAQGRSRGRAAYQSLWCGKEIALELKGNSFRWLSLAVGQLTQ